MPTDAKAILEAATADQDRIYFVGPLGRRVNFTAQQRRALNLVWALAQEGELAEHPTVAVIGAGIGGVMTAAALTARNCVVHLYEGRGAPLELQALATHRFLHPTMNFWPAERPRVTTILPFFDWYAGACSEALELLREEWDDHVGPHLPHPTYNHTVIGARWHRRRKKVEIRFRGHPPQYFDLAIVVTGFGDEQNLGDKGQWPYWKADDLTTYVGKQGQSYFVSGIGDGGSIDFLRLIHSDFDKGELCEKFLNLVDTPAIEKRVKVIEEEADRRRRGSSPDPLSYKDDVARYYERSYTELLTELPQRALNILNGSLRTKNYVTLIGPLPAPYEYSVAPLHKVMLAHAFAWKNGESRGEDGRQYLQYKQGKVSRRGRVYYLRPVPTAPEQKLDYHLMVIRIGAAKSPLSGFIKNKAKRDELVRKQLDVIDDQNKPYDDDFFILNDYPKRDVDSEEFAETRTKIANRLTRSRYNCSVSVRPRVGGGGARFVYSLLDKRQNAEGVRLPTDLFGIALERGGRPPKPASLVGRDPP